MTTQTIGRSIMASSDASILMPMQGSFGVLQVKPLHELDTHGLFLTSPQGISTLLASHPNGYSCHSLAERICKVCKGNKPSEYAIEQYQYIIDCGGEGLAESEILDILTH